MKPLTALLLLFAQTSPAQTHWREQPKWLGIGLTIGLASGERTPATACFSAAFGKAAWDVKNSKTIDPFSSAYGAFLGTQARKTWRLRKRKEPKRPKTQL